MGKIECVYKNGTNYLGKENKGDSEERKLFSMNDYFMYVLEHHYFWTSTKRSGIDKASKYPLGRLFNEIVFIRERLVLTLACCSQLTFPVEGFFTQLRHMVLNSR